MIRDWIDDTNIFSTGIQPKLLYKATRDGFMAKEFQKRCSNLQNTLVIAKTNFNKIVGGFCPLPWFVPNANEKFKYFVDYTNSTFLFSVDDKEKYSIKKNSNAICLTKEHGPIYGNGSDFEIVDQCNVNYNNVNNLGNSFECKKSPKEFFGDAKYLISEYEVYQII